MNKNKITPVLDALHRRGACNQAMDRIQGQLAKGWDWERIWLATPYGDLDWVFWEGNCGSLDIACLLDVAEEMGLPGLEDEWFQDPEDHKWTIWGMIRAGLGCGGDYYAHRFPGGACIWGAPDETARQVILDHYPWPDVRARLLERATL